MLTASQQSFVQPDINESATSRVTIKNRNSVIKKESKVLVKDESRQSVSKVTMKTTNGIGKTKKTIKGTSSTYMKGKAKKGKKGKPSALENNSAKGRTILSDDSDVEEADSPQP